MSDRDEYKKRLNTFQRRLLTLQLFVIALGGLVFALGVLCRPLLRIIKHENYRTVKWIVNVMVSASLIQMIAAGYAIFSGCFRRIYPIYLGIATTSLTVVWELTAIISSIFLYTNSPSMVNEEIVQAWYWVECLKFESCHDRMLGYIHWYILPQVIISIITVILQCTTIMMLSKLVRTIAQRFNFMQEAQEKYRDDWEEKKFNEASQKFSPLNSSNVSDVQTNAADSTDDILKTPKRVQFTDMDGGSGGSGSSSARKRAAVAGSSRGISTDNMEMQKVHTTSYQAQIHVEVPTTPCSIITEDHGYIKGSSVSLDFDKA